MEASAPASRGQPHQLGWRLLVAVVGFVLGYGYLLAVRLALDFLWTDIPLVIGAQVGVALYIVAMLTAGSALVAWFRRRMGVFGHSPLDGLVVRVDSLRASLVSLAAVIMSLLAGLVLGPEAGLLALGTAVAVFLADRLRSSDHDREVLVRFGAIGAVLALGLALGGNGGISLGAGPQGVMWPDFTGAVVVSLAAAGVLAVVRLFAYQVRRKADLWPVAVPRVTVVGLVIAVIAVVAFEVTKADPRLVLGSGEGYIRAVLELRDLSVLAVVLVAKALAYALSLGGGVRGGPIFPAMFLGAAVAALLGLLGLPGNTVVVASAGVLAATAVGLALKWPVLLISGVVIGLLLGGWQLIPACIVGLLLGRFVGWLLGRVPGVGPVPDPSTTSGSQGSHRGS